MQRKFSQEAVGALPALGQRQDSLVAQLEDLHRIALRFGLELAAIWVAHFAKLASSELPEASPRWLIDLPQYELSSSSLRLQVALLRAAAQRLGMRDAVAWMDERGFVLGARRQLAA